MAERMAVGAWTSEAIEGEDSAAENELCEEGRCTSKPTKIFRIARAADASHWSSPGARRGGDGGDGRVVGWWRDEGRSGGVG